MASRADQIVPLTRARGLKFLAVATSTNPSLAASIAAKYGPSHGGGVDAIEVLNEPDLHNMTPAQYLSVVNAVVPTIRAADPKMFIVVGAISSAAPGNPMNWLAQLYAANGNRPLPGDAVSYHDYLSWPGESTQYHTIMSSHGDGAKPIWDTETGSSTADVSEAQQAVNLRNIANQANANSAFVAETFVYQIRDIKTGDGVQYNNYGLYRTDGTAKPSVAAFVATR